MFGLIDPRRLERRNKPASDVGNRNDLDVNFRSETRPGFHARQRAERDLDSSFAHRLQILLRHIRGIAGNAVDLQRIGSDGENISDFVAFDGNQIFIADMVGKRIVNGIVHGDGRDRPHARLCDRLQYARDIPLNEHDDAYQKKSDDHGHNSSAQFGRLAYITLHAIILCA